MHGRRPRAIRLQHGEGRGKEGRGPDRGRAGPCQERVTSLSLSLFHPSFFPSPGKKEKKNLLTDKRRNKKNYWGGVVVPDKLANQQAATRDRPPSRTPATLAQEKKITAFKQYDTVVIKRLRSLVRAGRNNEIHTYIHDGRCLGGVCRISRPKG